MKNDEPHVSEQGYRDLLERGGLISDTAGTAGWTMWVDFVNEERANRQRKIVAGGCASHEEYLKDVAWLAGAEYVINAPAMVNSRIAEYKQVLTEMQEAEGE